MVAIIVAANLPKIAYQDVIVHCNDYDRINRSGQHQDLMAMAGVLDCALCTRRTGGALGWLHHFDTLRDRQARRAVAAGQRSRRPAGNRKGRRPDAGVPA